MACWKNFFFMDWLCLSYLQLVFFFYNVHNKIMHICTYMSVIHSGLLGDTQNVKADKTTELCGTVVKK